MRIAMIIETLEAMNRNVMACRDIFLDDGNERAANDCLMESMTLDTVLSMLRSDRSAREYRAIYFPEEAS